MWWLSSIKQGEVVAAQSRGRGFIIMLSKHDWLFWFVCGTWTFPGDHMTYHKWQIWSIRRKRKIFLHVAEINGGSENCPNGWLFCLIYWAMIFYWNHMILHLVDSQHVLVYHMTFSEFLLMLFLHIIPIFQKCTNIGAVFWPTVSFVNQVARCPTPPPWYLMNISQSANLSSSSHKFK